MVVNVKEKQEKINEKFRSNNILDKSHKDHVRLSH